MASLEKNGTTNSYKVAKNCSARIVREDRLDQTEFLSKTFGDQSAVLAIIYLGVATTYDPVPTRDNPPSSSPKIRSQSCVIHPSVWNGGNPPMSTG